MWTPAVIEFILGGKCTSSAGCVEMLSMRTNVGTKAGSGGATIDHSVTGDHLMRMVSSRHSFPP